MSRELLNRSCRELRDEIAGGEVSSVEVTKAVFEAIEKYEGQVGAYISTFEKEALERAGEIDKKVAAGEGAGAL